MKETKVRIRNYMDYSSNNYGAHSLEVTIGGLTLWFSYETIIGFEYIWRGRKTKSDPLEPAERISAVTENIWGPTTGKHLNAICVNKENRLSRDEFTKQLEKCLKRHKLNI